MFEIWITLCIVCLLATAVVHSLGGERYLIGPMFTKRGNAVLEMPLGRLILRFAWHLTSLMWVMLAVMLYGLAFDPGAAVAYVLGGIGVTFCFVGLFDLIASRGRHIGWPFLLMIGVFALLALFMG